MPIDSLASGIIAGLAVEAIKALMKPLISRVLKEIKLVSWDFEEQLVKLQDKLVYIEAFLSDVTHQQAESQLLDLWLQKVKDAVYLASEVMDDYALEMHRKKKMDITARISTKLSNLKANPMGFHSEMSKKVKKVFSIFDDLDKEAKKMGLKKVDNGTIREDKPSSSSSRLYQVRKHASARGSEFVGRKFDQDKLLEILCNGELFKEEGGGDLSILAIVGIGGLGKTTLARRVFEHKNVDQQFEKRKIWICVSENFNVENLLREMVESLTSCKCDLSNTGAIINKLKEELKGRKFLLVLDDVWNSNLDLWDSLKNELRRIGDLVGSVILVTTRSIEVVEKARAVYAHKLEGLSEDDSWSLLKQKDFSGSLLNPSSFEEIGRRIAQKCKGVPLAIRAIRGILQSMKHPLEWESVERSELWDLLEDDENFIMPSLLLSYTHLPSLSLKQCFSYCAIFPKDESMEKGQLVALWLAQGFIHESGKNNLSLTMEDIGESYLQILVNNSFLQEERVDKTSGQTLTYKMHDLVHDLAVYVSQKDMLLWKSETRLNYFSFRHCVFIFKENEIINKALAGMKMDKVRTISYLNGKPMWDLMICARYMRTLIIAKIGLEGLPSDIEQLRNLRYLDLSENPIKILPDSLCKLYQLQTLRLLGCNLLKKLPREFHRLINLRHVLTSFCVLAPKGLQQLTCLQTLPRLKLSGEDGWTIDELGSLHDLRGEVCISNLEHVKNKETAWKAGIRRHEKVFKLNLSWDPYNEIRSDNIDKDVLDGLEPHPSLTSLKLEHFNGVEFPPWIMTMAVKHGSELTSLTNLTVIELASCKRCQKLPTLGELPFLRLLNLKEFKDVQCIGCEFYLSEQNLSINHLGVATDKVAFAALKELQIDYFPSLTTWLPPPPPAGATAFPCLERLKVVNCPRLYSIPAQNLQYLKHLQATKLAVTQRLDVIITNNVHLTRITLCAMLEMSSLPEELSTCTNLQHLKLINCAKLTSIPVGLKSLVSLEIWNCGTLSCLDGMLFHGLNSLREVSIWKCDRLQMMPISLQECTQIEELKIEDCPLIEGSVPDLSKLAGLVNLTIFRSGQLMTSVIDSIPHFPRLRKLEFGGFRHEEYLSDKITSITFKNHSLKYLTLKDCPRIKFLPQHLQLMFPSLTFLKIASFCNLEELPEWIENLSSLEELWLWKCDKLKCLPSKQIMQRLTRLQSLHIYVCPLLKENFAERECHKITHISHIQIDCEDVQDLKS